METNAQKANKSVKSKAYFDFVKEDDNKKIYKCKECSKIINGSKLSNLTSHLKVHPSIYHKLVAPDVNIEKKRIKLLLDFVELVTVNGRAFNCLLDSAIISMNEQVLNELKDAGREVNLQDPHLTEIKEFLKKIDEKMRVKVSNEVKSRAVSLLVDIVTKHGRSLLGFSVQYMINGECKTRSIGMIELMQSHTGIYLAELITKRLEEFGIDLRQVITITTDNGSNVLKMVRDMESHLAKAVDDAKNKPDESVQSNLGNPIDIDEDSVDREIEDILTLPVGITDDDALAIIFRDNDEPNDYALQTNQTLLNAITTNMTETHGLDILWDVNGINCAAHTLQLVIGDTLKACAKSTKNIIALCRQVAKYLRLNTTVHEMKQIQIIFKKPRLDVETRWGSTYLMV